MTKYHLYVPTTFLNLGQIGKNSRYLQFLITHKEDSSFCYPRCLMCTTSKYFLRLWSFKLSFLRNLMQWLHWLTANIKDKFRYRFCNSSVWIYPWLSLSEHQSDSGWITKRICCIFQSNKTNWSLGFCVQGNEREAASPDLIQHLTQ